MRKIAYRETQPSLRGRIRYPGLYLIFSTLQSFNLLDDLTHAEILDLCDAFGLDRFQNRIEDVNYVTKRLHEFRRFQNLRGLSIP